MFYQPPKLPSLITKNYESFSVATNLSAFSSRAALTVCHRGQDLVRDSELPCVRPSEDQKPRMTDGQKALFPWRKSAEMMSQGIVFSSFLWSSIVFRFCVTNCAHRYGASEAGIRILNVLLLGNIWNQWKTQRNIHHQKLSEKYSEIPSCFHFHFWALNCSKTWNFYCELSNAWSQKKALGNRFWI